MVVHLAPGTFINKYNHRMKTEPKNKKARFIGLFHLLVFRFFFFVYIEYTSNFEICVDQNAAVDINSVICYTFYDELFRTGAVQHRCGTFRWCRILDCKVGGSALIFLSLLKLCRIL